MRIFRSKLTYLILANIVIFTLIANIAYNYYLENYFESPPLGTFSNGNFDGLRFVSYCSGENSVDSICIMNIDGTSELKNFVIPREGVTFEQPVVSPDGIKVAFKCGEESFWGDICVANIVGEGPVTTLTNAQDYTFWWPVWSPDSSKIAAYCGGSACVIDVVGDGKVTELFSKPYLGVSMSNPSWSPDSKKIVGVCDEITICIATLEGNRRFEYPYRNRDASWPELSWPAWSPDGTQIAFSCYNDICLINANGTGEVLNLSKMANFYTTDSWKPIWSSDGTQILYHCISQADFLKQDAPWMRGQHCVINSDGSGFGINITRTLRNMGISSQVRYRFTNGAMIIYDCRNASHMRTCPNYGKPLGDPFELASAFVGPEEIDTDKLCTLTYAENFEVCQEPSN